VSVAVEAYIPEHVEFDGRAVESPVAVTLYDPDGQRPRGSMTAHGPIPAGSTGGLVFQGRRGGKVWSVVCPEITVTNKSALGCEFVLSSPPQRTVLAEEESEEGPREKGLEERFDIR